MIKEKLTPANLIKVAKLNGFEIFSDGRLNIWGVRTPRGEFNDYFVYFWMADGKWNSIVCEGTTEPGQNYLGKVLGNPNGTAVLQHNKQYIDCWEIRKHKQQYDALCQRYSFKFAVWRDKNYNNVVDYEGKTYWDAAGINNHTTKMGYVRNFIGGFSAGCQVIWSHKIFTYEIMPVVKALRELHKNKYSYTLVLDDLIKAI